MLRPYDRSVAPGYSPAIYTSKLRKRYHIRYREWELSHRIDDPDAVYSNYWMRPRVAVNLVWSSSTAEFVNCMTIEVFVSQGPIMTVWAETYHVDDTPSQAFCKIQTALAEIFHDSTISKSA